MPLGYYKSWVGISKRTNSLVVRGDLGLFSLRSRRLVNMVRLWEKILVMPRVWVMKVAYLEMLKGHSGSGWPYQIKSVLVQCGLSHMWGDGLGLEDMGDQVSRLVERILLDQEIQAWQAQRSLSNCVRQRSLGLHCRSKEIWGEVLFFKVGLNKNNIKLLIEMKADSLPLGQRRKFIGREKSKAGPYFCPMCGGLDLERVSLDV